jgi:diguanylate cyclase (GGDEF)-like protein
MTLENKIRERTEQLYQEANTDFLTGARNRRSILNHLENEIERFKRYQRPCSILMLDVDFFKAVNDKHGHQIGDEALVLISKNLSDNCRESDSLGRYGGEEFLIVLPETSNQESQVIAERIRHSVSVLKLDIGLSLTVSIGIASLNEQNQVELDALIKQADDAVYKAKKLGRNRVVSG